MPKEQTDILPDMSSEIASMGRGSLARRIAQLEQELATAKLTQVSVMRNIELLGYSEAHLVEVLDEAKEALAGIAADDNTWQGQEAKAALVLIAHLLK